MPLELREIDSFQSYGYRNRNEFEILEKRKEVKQEINELKLKVNLNQNEENRLDELYKKLKLVKEEL